MDGARALLLGLGGPWTVCRTMTQANPPTDKSAAPRRRTARPDCYLTPFRGVCSLGSKVLLFTDLSGTLSAGPGMGPSALPRSGIASRERRYTKRRHNLCIARGRLPGVPGEPEGISRGGAAPKKLFAGPCCSRTLDLPDGGEKDAQQITVIDVRLVCTKD